VRILLVEDEPAAARYIAKGLREAAYAVDIVGNGIAAWEQCRNHEYDAIILDVMLPGRDGLAVCRQLRASGSKVSVLMLTARDAVEARVQGLDAGADDYLTKPFHFRELLARVRALTRRERRPPPSEPVTIGPLTIDVSACRVWVHGQEVAFPHREYVLLEYLARHAGEIIRRTRIVEDVWGEHHDALSNVVEVHIQRLRRRLDDHGASALIRTHRGHGYELSDRNRNRVSE